jgi:hypothetical protein
MELVSIPAIAKVKNSIHQLSVISDVLKYRDPLHILLEYVAEVSILAWRLVFYTYNMPDN